MTEAEATALLDAEPGTREYVTEARVLGFTDLAISAVITPLYFEAFQTEAGEIPPGPPIFDPGVPPLGSPAWWQDLLGP